MNTGAQELPHEILLLINTIIYKIQCQVISNTQNMTDTLVCFVFLAQKR